MKLDLDLQELLELKGALIERQNRLKDSIKTDKSICALLDADSIETIDTLLQKIDAAIKQNM